MRLSKKSPFTFFDRFMNLFEQAPNSDRFFLKLLFFTILGSTIWLALSYNQSVSEETPIHGGSITEGIIGTPRFVNPALAITRADQDVSALVYSGLMRLNTDGKLINDLADSITLSEDGLTYNVVVRRDVKFHDGTPLTARDVSFTYQLIQDPNLKSPLRANWTGVTIEQVDEYELNIILEDPYAPFIENFTVGILPAYAWDKLPIEQLPFSQLNTEPIGSGPFSVTQAIRDTSGVIDSYTLTAFRNSIYEPKLDTIRLTFYTNEEDLVTAVYDNKIDSTVYLPLTEVANVVEEGFKLNESPMPRIFGVFFNQNKSTALRDASAREALEVALDRNILIRESLEGYGVPISRPTTFSQTAIIYEDGIAVTPTTTPSTTPETILKEGGWQQNNIGLWEKDIDGDTITLEVTIRTSNIPLFEKLTNSITEQWEAIGVNVSSEQFEQTGLIQSVIRPRDFQALLFGIDTNRQHDLYSFWHSSQQDDPGLNIAQYTNVTVDDLLESSQGEQNEEKRLAYLQEASNIISAERPAILLFQPTLPYVVKEDVSLSPFVNLARPSDRFSNVTEWHTKSANLWSLFR